MYIVNTHTLRTSTINTVMRKFGTEITMHVTGDCFYGVGESPYQPECRVRVQIHTLSEPVARQVAEHLYHNDYEVYVTSDFDEHTDPWNLGVIPMNYAATHAH